MKYVRIFTLVMRSGILLFACATCSSPAKTLQAVTYAQFEEFVKATGYVTDAEKFGWSIVQRDLFNYLRVDGANWRKPDGFHVPASRDLPVTQVSYNDAMAYCEWSGTMLPTYEDYWEFANDDLRPIVAHNSSPISPIQDVNIIGNVWDITSTHNGERVRLAGGSLYCSPNMCNGTSQERELFVDKQTANIHIGFAVFN